MNKSLQRLYIYKYLPLRQLQLEGDAFDQQVAASTSSAGFTAAGPSCPTRKLYVHPRVAYSVKGKWHYIVNLPQREHQQGILTEECM